MCLSNNVYQGALFVFVKWYSKVQKVKFYGLHFKIFGYLIIPVRDDNYKNKK